MIGGRVLSKFGVVQHVEFGHQFSWVKLKELDMLNSLSPYTYAVAYGSQCSANILRQSFDGAAGLHEGIE